MSSSPSPADSGSLIDQDESPKHNDTTVTNNNAGTSAASDDDSSMMEMDNDEMTKTREKKAHDQTHQRHDVEQDAPRSVDVVSRNEVPDPSTNGLFDYSSYTGGAPSLIAIGDVGTNGNVTGGDGLPGTSEPTALFGQELEPSDSHGEMLEKAALESEEKKLGRPSHPAWEHFVRGEKRNRFHHHAFCKYCTANGANPPPIRGVSGNMIRHLQKCIYCPSETVTQLKILCAQKDAAIFNKRHQSHGGDVDILLPEAPSPVPTKRVKRTHRTLVVPSPLPLRSGPTSGGRADIEERDGTRQPGHGADEEFMPLQLPLMQSDLGHVGSTPLQPTLQGKSPEFGQNTTLASAGKPNALLRSGSWSASKKNTKISLAYDSHRIPRSFDKRTDIQVLNPQVLNKLVLTATVSAELPWDWIWMEESTRLFGEWSKDLQSLSSTMLPTIAANSHKVQLAQMKEHDGVTLAVNSWTSKYQKTHYVLCSLLNAFGEASAWEVIDMGVDEYSSDDLSLKIKNILTALQEQGIHVFNIVADTTIGYAAARIAVNSLDGANHAVPVLPCFSHLLSVLLGVVLTFSDCYVETMGNMIELVQVFSNYKVLKVLNRESGDPDAALVLPSKDHWYSFIECVDSVRQYEDMIKIIASKVQNASSSSATTASDSNGVGVAPPRKDSAGNTTDELAGAALSSSVLRTIHNPEFWESVVFLSELMSPIKETYKIMTNISASTLSMSNVFYQFGRMHQQYGIILSDLEENTCGARTMEHVRYLQRVVNRMWKLYDQPLMFLSYVFNYNFAYPYLARNHPSFQWLSIGKYAKEYFRRWFCNASSMGGAGSRPSISDEAVSQFLDDLLAYKDRKHPFDAESFFEFENPRSFYLLISDSNPLMHLFGSRLFSFATSTPRLNGIMEGKHFISSSCSTAYDKDVLLPMFQLKLFAQTAVRPSKDVIALIQHYKGKDNMNGNSAQLRNESTGMPQLPDQGVGLIHLIGEKICGVGTRTRSKLWNKRQWGFLAKEWKAHCDTETDTNELLRNLSSLDPGLLRFAPDLSLDEIFKEKLPSRLLHDREEAVVDV